MKLVSKIFLLGIFMGSCVMAAPAVSQSVSEGVKKIYIPVPAGIDISKHQTPPPGFNKTSTKTGLKKRDYTAQFAYLEIFDNWWYDYNADNVMLWVDPNSGPHLFEESTNLKNRISSIKLYSHAYPGKACTVTKDYYWNNGGLQCVGVGIQLTALNSPAFYGQAQLQGDFNDSLKCFQCWYVWQW